MMRTESAWSAMSAEVVSSAERLSATVKVSQTTLKWLAPAILRTWRRWLGRLAERSMAFSPGATKRIMSAPAALAHALNSGSRLPGPTIVIFSPLFFICWRCQTVLRSLCIKLVSTLPSFSAMMAPFVG